jgi:hypothetical protein
MRSQIIATSLTVLLGVAGSGLAGPAAAQQPQPTPGGQPQVPGPQEAAGQPEPGITGQGPLGPGITGHDRGRLAEPEPRMREEERLGPGVTREDPLGAPDTGIMGEQEPLGRPAPGITGQQRLIPGARPPGQGDPTVGTGTGGPVGGRDVGGGGVGGSGGGGGGLSR